MSYPQGEHAESSYPAPGSPQQSGAHPPTAPSPRRRTGWIVGGVIGAVLVLVCAAGGAFAAVQLLGGSDTEAGRAGASGEVEEGGPADDTYEPVWGLCEDVDYSPVFDVLPYTATATDDESLMPGNTLFTQCTFFLDIPTHMGRLFVQVGTTLEHSFAVRSYESGLEIKRQGRQPSGSEVTFVDLLEGAADNPEATDLPWQHATLILVSGSGTTIELHVVEDNLNVEVGISTTAELEELTDLFDPEEALREVAANVREAMRQRNE